MGTWSLSIVASRPSIFIVYALIGIKPNQTESNRIKPFFKDGLPKSICADRHLSAVKPEFRSWRG
jgi:hypothetical protein